MSKKFTKEFTVGTLQQDIRTQMEASRELLDVARDLQKLAEDGNPESKKTINDAVRRLARIGNMVVENIGVRHLRGAV